MFLMFLENKRWSFSRHFICLSPFIIFFVKFV